MQTDTRGSQGRPRRMVASKNSFSLAFSFNDSTPERRESGEVSVEEKKKKEEDPPLLSEPGLSH